MIQTFVRVFESTSRLKKPAASAAIYWLEVRLNGVAHVARTRVASALR